MKYAAEAKGRGASGEAEAQRAIFYLLQYLGESAAPLTTVAEPKRDSWMRALRFLDDCLATTALDGLSLALADLEKGNIDPAFSVAPKVGRRGPSWRELVAMRVIVEGADALRAEVENDLVYRLELKAAGVPYSTVEDHRRRIGKAGGEWANHRSFILTYGSATPVDVIRRGAVLLASVRRSLKGAV
ncbi:hypothetical protein [Sphingobium chungbukense]|uniref:hypothetical protein n=1 Tax=Sphingobium chungbukense TaxID=56193 RepID=UPI0012EE7D18|nr:hypothetical protein [Sphingobium chungbukense]